MNGEPTTEPIGTGVDTSAALPAVPEAAAMATVGANPADALNPLPDAASERILNPLDPAVSGEKLDEAAGEGENAGLGAPTKPLDAEKGLSGEIAAKDEPAEGANASGLVLGYPEVAHTGPAQSGAEVADPITAPVVEPTVAVGPVLAAVDATPAPASVGGLGDNAAAAEPVSVEAHAESAVDSSLAGAPQEDPADAIEPAAESVVNPAPVASEVQPTPAPVEGSTDPLAANEVKPTPIESNWGMPGTVLPQVPAGGGISPVQPKSTAHAILHKVGLGRFVGGSNSSAAPVESSATIPTASSLTSDPVGNS